MPLVPTEYNDRKSRPRRIDSAAGVGLRGVGRHSIGAESNAPSAQAPLSNAVIRINVNLVQTGAAVPISHGAR